MISLSNVRVGVPIGPHLGVPGDERREKDCGTLSPLVTEDVCPAWTDTQEEPEE